MKYFILLIFAGTLLGADFQSAERLFLQGKFDECNGEITDLLASKNKITLSPPERNKLLAMQEYITGTNPDRREEIVKRAEEIAAHKNWLTADLLNHSALLIRRAEDWKYRGIPEYQRLSDAAEKLLAYVKDGGDPAIAIKIVMLRTRNLNLNGEYQEPLNLIRRILRHYYPRIWLSSGKMPEGAAMLLILGGEQHVGIGIRCNNKRGKAEAFLQAAKYYLRAVKSLTPKHPQYQDLCDRLHYCRTTLRLLGYQLRLPTKIKPRQDVEVAMIDEMLRNRRFHDVVLALEKNEHPALRFRYAAALSAIGQIDDALAVIAAENAEIREPQFLLIVARNALLNGKKAEAMHLLERFLALAPDSPDAPAATRDYADLLIEAGKYEEAAQALLNLSGLIKEQNHRRDAQFRAAQCLYQAGKFDGCVDLLRPLNKTTDMIILLAQAKIRCADEAGALAELKSLLKKAEKLSAIQRRDALKLAIPCAMNSDTRFAGECIRALLTEYPGAPEGFDYAKHLLGLYESQKADTADYLALGEWSLTHHLQSSETVPLLLECVSFIPGQADKEKLLRGLLKRSSFDTKELTVMLKYLPSTPLKLEFLNRFKPPFDNAPTTCELYFHIAELEMTMKNYETVLQICGNLLRQREIFRYKECKFLQAEAFVASGQEKEARLAWQELLLTELDPNTKRQVVLALAQSWERGGDSRKAVVTAWTAVPLDGRADSSDAQREIDNLLRLIMRNARKINSQPDIDDATALCR